MKRFIMALVITVLLASIFLASCGEPAETTTTTTTTATTTAATTTAAATTTPTAVTPQRGGSITIITEPGLTNLGYPATNRAVLTDGILAAPAVENLVGLDRKGGGTPVPELATSWQYNADRSALTMNLRQGVKFHDGTDFNAEAAKYNLDIVRKAGNLGTLDSVTSIDIIDNYTIQLNLSSYDPGMLANMAANAAAGAMVSPTALETMGEDATFHPVGTGPFKFVSYQTDVSLKYTRNENYWQPNKPYLDGLEFIFIKDSTTALNTLRAGEAQALRGIDNKSAAQLLEDGDYGLNLIPQGLVGLAFDGAHSDSPFSDIRVRQAVSHAIDTSAIVNVMGYGVLTLTNQIYAPGSYAYNPDVIGYPFDPQKARDLLSQTEYPTGFKTTIHLENSSQNRDLSIAIQGYLSEVGIDLEVDLQDPAKYMETRVDGWNNGMIQQMMPASPGFDPGLGLMLFLSSKTTRLGNPEIVYIPGDYDAKLAEATIEGDATKRRELFKQLSKMIIDQYCMCTPLYIEVGIAAYSNKVHDFYINKYAGCDYAPEDIWLSK